MTLDGAVQSVGADDDKSGGFGHGGWHLAYLDETEAVDALKGEDGHCCPKCCGDTETDHRAPGKPPPSSSPPTDGGASPQQSARRAARSPALTRYAGLISDRTRDSCCALSENLPFNMAILAASAMRAVTRPTSRFSVIPSETYPMVEARAPNSA
jgi:hypothetical protein